MASLKRLPQYSSSSATLSNLQHPACPPSPKKTAPRFASSNGDRFIPQRQNVHSAMSKLGIDKAASFPAASQSSLLTSGGAMDVDDPGELTDDDNDEDVQESILPTNKSTYRTSVAEACGISLNTRILEFQPAPPKSSRPADIRSQYNYMTRPQNDTSAKRRKVSSSPERILDAPGIVDDYYLNVLDWSSNNQVAIGLDQSVYVWNANTGSVSSLMDTSNPNDYICSVKWSDDGCYLAIGLSDGDVQIWDIEDQVKLRSMPGHISRVPSLSWNSHLLSSGCRDGSIWNHDVRIAQHKVAELHNHSAEVCGLAWRLDGSQLASGGNDNLVNIWDARSNGAPKFSKTNHTAAVKALSWCPWQSNLLATGGGSQDKHIHFWNSTTGSRVNSIETSSQVTSLKWNSTFHEIVSTHGFPNNHLTIWEYPTLNKVSEIIAHDSRVLHSALSPDGQVLATCASDENLKFWKLFDAPVLRSSAVSSSLEGKVMGKTMMIR